MTLHKGFLRQVNSEFSKTVIWTGILIGVFVALAFFLFSIYIREALRLATINFIGHLLVLNSKEAHFYDYFYAFLASITGCGFTLRYILENLKKRAKGKLRISHRLALNNIKFQTWHTNYIISDTFLKAGLMITSMPLQFDIDFYEEYWFFFVLILVFYYLSLWLHTYRILRKNTYRWMFIALGIIIVNSFLLNQLNPLDYERINKVVTANDIDQKYEVKVPSITSIEQGWNRHYQMFDIYVGYDKTGNQNDVKIVVNEYSDLPIEELSLDEIGEYFSRISASDLIGFGSIIVLHIDQKVNMGFVNQLKQALTELDNYTKLEYNTILYAATPKYSKYPKDYPGFKRMGIKQWFPWFCPDVIQKIDSLKAMGYTARQVRFPDGPCYRTAHLKDYNRLKVSVLKNQLLLNNQPVTTKKLKELLIKFSKKYSDKGVIIYEVDNEASFLQYMKIMDLMRGAVLSVRQEEALKSLKINYTPPHETWGDERDQMWAIKRKYPFNFLEMTESDRYLYEYVKESQ